MPSATISDVARLAGVSKATVSRVLSGGYAYLREETRQRVLQAVRQLDYRPSALARGLSAGSSRTAAILLGDIANPFYTDIILGVEDAALENGYNVFLANTSYDPTRGLALVRSLIDRRVDGIILMATITSEEWLAELEVAGIPIVLLDWEPAPPRSRSAILSIDFETGILAAVDHLWALGHRDFAHISGPLSLATARTRCAIFLKALEDRGLPPESVPVVEGNFRMDGGRAAMMKLLALPSLPSAVFAANDLMALGATAQARRAGIYMPEELSLVGMDNIWLAAEADPPLTSIALPRRQIGANALTALLALAASPDTLPPPLQFSTSLVVRQSTAPGPFYSKE